MRQFFFYLALILLTQTAVAEPARLSRQWLSSKFASDGDEFRQIRRVGVGSTIGGINGVFGINLDLNFTATTSFGLSYGVGNPFNAFSFYIRRYMGNQTFSPYFAAGYSRWYQTSDSHGQITTSTPSFLAERLLSEEQRKTGKFQKNFLFPALGLQFTQYSGDWAGLALALEVDLLVDIENMVSASTGGINCTYYF